VFLETIPKKRRGVNKFLAGSDRLLKAGKRILADIPAFFLICPNGFREDFGLTPLI
jgi:hypothetical protein